MTKKAEIKTNSIKFHPDKKVVDVEGEPTILEVAQNSGIEIESACGGFGVCGSCQVKILTGSDYLSEKDEDEIETIEFFDIPDSKRLACKAHIKGCVEVEV